MTYILTDGELQTLLAISGQTGSGLPRITLNESARKKILSGNIEYRASGLIKTGLLEVGPDGKYRPTKEGKIAAAAFSAPEAIVRIGRKNSTDGIFSAFKFRSIWIVYSDVLEQKLNMITFYFSTESLGKWINEQFIETAPADVKADSKINVSLSYDEWYLWLMSQLVFIRRDLSDKQSKIYFEPDELCNKTALEYLSGSLKALGKTDAADSIRAMFVSPINSRILAAIKGLVKKGVLNVKAGSDKELRMFYTNKAIQWMDNDLLTDTLFFCKKKNGKDNTIIFQLRRTGICAVYNTGSGIKLITADDIPWSAYLEV